MENKSSVMKMASDQCPACGSAQFEDLPEIPFPACKDCGLIISDDVDAPPEPDDPGTTDRETPTWSEYYSTTNSTEHQTASGLESLEDLGNRLRLSIEAVEEASDVFAEAAIKNLADGRSMQLIVAAAICIGARKASEPRPTGSIAEAAGVAPNRLKQATRLFQRSLIEGYTANPPDSYLPYLRRELNLPEPTEERAQRLFDEFNSEVSTGGKDPVGIACAALYAASDGTTQREVADAAGITQETIRVRLNELRAVVNTE